MPFKNWQEEVNALVEGGHADDKPQGRELRKQIIDGGSTVEKWLKARPAAASYDDPTLSGADEMSDLTALMRAEGIGLGHAKLLRSQILEGGKTVRDFLLADAVHGSYGLPNTADIFRRAGDLVKLAGGKDRAIKAIEAYDDLDAAPTESE